MSSKSIASTVFVLPSNQKSASQTFYGIMIAGLFFLPLTLLIYQRFFFLRLGVSTKEFFIILSAIFILLFILISAASSKASSELRKKLNENIPRDVTLITTIAAGSDNPEIVELARKYWRWQLVSSYFSGIAFSWLACIFILFVF